MSDLKTRAIYRHHVHLNTGVRLESACRPPVSTTQHSAAFRLYLCHALFLICRKYRICPRNNCAEGVQPKHPKFQPNTADLCLSELFTLQRQRLHEKCHIHSFHSSSTRVKICTQAIFFPVVCTPREVIRQMTSDFDVNEVDVENQLNFLNPAR